MMHLPDFRMHCFDASDPDPSRPAPAPWAIDGGRCCGNAADPETWKRHLAYTPTCDGCGKARRALWLHETKQAGQTPKEAA